MLRAMSAAMASAVAASLLLSTPAFAQSEPSGDDVFRVTLLGTGVPIPRADRFGPSTLVEAGPEKLLFDVGRGATIRLWQAGVRLSAVKVFLTHHHSDHTSGIPDLWLSGWLPPAWAQRKTPFTIFGPRGTKRLMEGLQIAYEPDILIRIPDENLTRDGIGVAATDIEPGFVWESGGVRVMAFEVDHGNLIKPAFGYRIDYKGRSVLISGDTRYNQNVIKHGAGVDLLIHEVAAAKPELLARSEGARRILAHHTTPQEAGRIFSQTRPKLAVYTHIGAAGGTGADAPGDDDYVKQTRETYDGPLQMGEDLMSFTIGDTVTVSRKPR